MSIKNKLQEYGLKFSTKFERGASYLLSDGTFLNLAEQDETVLYSKTRFSFEKVIAHHVLDNLIIRSNLVDHSLLDKIYEERSLTPLPKFIYLENIGILKYTDNAIILNNAINYKFENCYIDLPPKPLNSKQSKSLLLFLDNLYYNKKTNLEVSLNGKVYNLDLTNSVSEDIVLEIKRIYIKDLK